MVPRYFQVHNGQGCAHSGFVTWNVQEWPESSQAHQEASGQNVLCLLLGSAYDSRFSVWQAEGSEGGLQLGEHKWGQEKQPLAPRVLGGSFRGRGESQSPPAIAFLPSILLSECFQN